MSSQGLTRVPGNLEGKGSSSEEDDDDFHGFCHTWECVGHALQAGEQATSSFIQRFRKRWWQEDTYKLSDNCVPTFRYTCVRNCVQTTRYDCAPYSSYIRRQPRLVGSL
jgi:hypothetical protein